MVSLGEHEGGDGEQEEQRFAVDRDQEQGHGKDGEVEHGAAGGVGAEPFLGQPMQEQERSQ